MFDGTVLEDIALGSKVNVLEEALNFLNENLNIDFPTVNETVLVLSLLMKSLR
jgi:hypothetical protein